MSQCQICHSLSNYPVYGYIEYNGIYLQRIDFTWSDDPLKTPLGLAGEDYKGLVFVNPYHIYELQQARFMQERAVGVPYNDRTQFSFLSPPYTSLIIPNKKHIEELRESTEKILNKLGFTLEQYFNYEINVNYDRQYYIGQYYGTYKYGEKVEDKTEWEDIDRTTGKPSLPSVTNIRAIHIEELRHNIPIIYEMYIPTLVVEPSNILFNLRCPDNSGVEVQVFGGYGDEDYFWSLSPGGDSIVNLEPIWNYDTHKTDKAIVTPKGIVGFTDLIVHFPATLPYGASIQVVKSVSYEGDLNRTIKTITYQVFNIITNQWETRTDEIVVWVGSGIGCDDSSIDVEYNFTSIKGAFDGVNFNVPMTELSISSSVYVIINGEIVYLPQIPAKTIPSSTIPPYPSGFYTQNLSSYIEPGVGEAYAINGYKISGNAGYFEKWSWSYQLEDTNQDGVIESWVRHDTLIDSGGEFEIGFSYDPTLV